MDKFKDAAIGQIRHYISGAGTFLIAQGIASEADVQTGIGAAMTIIGLLWSVLDKYLAKSVTPKPPVTP